MTTESLRIAVVYIAEAYQSYHGAAAAMKLDAMEDVEVTSFYFDPDTPRHVERIHQAFGASPMRMVPLARSFVTRALQGVRVLGKFKHLTLRDNRRLLDGFDAILAVENTLAMSRGEGIVRPRLIYTPHGFGDRAYAFVSRIATFDFVLLAGSKTEDQMLERGLIRPGQYALTGSIKLETAEQLAGSEPPIFSNGLVTILYNPHFEANLNSWARFLPTMLEEFRNQDRFNLIVAPHVKMFRTASAARRRSLEARSSERIRIDCGSDRSIDSTYLATSAIYVGDVSSQVYEFLSTPRPCVFLNAHRVDWRNNPNYLHWTLGDVVDEPGELMPAIRAASQRHHLYRDNQLRLAEAALGKDWRGASDRAAAAIRGFLEEDRARATSRIA